MSLDDIIQQSEDWLCPTCGSKPSKKYLSIIRKRSGDIVVRDCSDCNQWYHYCDIKGKMSSTTECCIPHSGIHPILDCADYPIGYSDDWLCHKCGSKPISNKYGIQYCFGSYPVISRYCSNQDCDVCFHYCEVKCEMCTFNPCYCLYPHTYKKYV